MACFEKDAGAIQRELRVEEVLERLAVSRETLIRWLKGKELQGRRVAELASARLRSGVVHPRSRVK